MGIFSLIKTRYHLKLHHRSWARVQCLVLRVECIGYQTGLRHLNMGLVQETQHLRLRKTRTQM